MACFSENFEQSWSGEEDSFLSSSFGLLDLPSEVLVLILRYLPLSDLANARLVSPLHFVGSFLITFRAQVGVEQRYLACHYLSAKLGFSLVQQFS